jgi:enamine deaminase RidA (YjgF/YER057c/UK114 family)
MKYFKKNFDELSVDIQISKFENDSDTLEYYFVFNTHNEKDSFEKQVLNIEESYYKIIKDLNIPRENCITKRFYVSDLLNQIEVLNKIPFSSKTKKNELCAISYIEQPPLSSSKVALITYHIVDKEKLLMQNSITDLILDRSTYQHIYSMGLANIEHNDSYEQTKAIFKNYDSTLNKLSVTLKDNVIRTWLYVQNVDSNYQGVVEGRKEFFDLKGLTKNSHFISSTGIEGRGENVKTKIFMDSYAIKGIEENQLKFLTAPTHLNPTHEYGVTFERGTSIDFGDRKHIYISGTASIDNKGEIVHKGDVLKQCDRALENISALLKNADSTLEETAHIIVYLRDYHDYNSIETHLNKKLLDVPRLIVIAPVCRTGWLIEIECIAIKQVSNMEYKNF